MRTHGTLAKWNDDRGFGFITPAKGPPVVFVHISEFPREGGRPTVGELISFEVVPGNDGKQRAVRVMRPGQKTARAPVTGAPPQPQSRWLSRSISLVIVAALGWYAFVQYTRQATLAEEGRIDAAAYVALPGAPVPLQPAPVVVFEEPPARMEAAPRPLPASPYSCDGRTMCSQMRSCAEATYFINHCPNTKMDGNRDGVPCESQWCG